MKLLSVLLAVGIPAGCIIHGQLSRPTAAEFVASLEEEEQKEWAGFEPITLESGPLPACDCPSSGEDRNGNELAFSLSDGVTEALVWLLDSASQRCFGACYIRKPDTVVMKGFPFGRYKLVGMCNGELVKRESGSLCEFKLKGGTTMIQDEEVHIYHMVAISGDTLPFREAYSIRTTITLGSH